MNDGGVTFSGGEALMQHEFVEDVCDHLPDVHKAIETSGYASEEVFLSVVSRLDLVMMDINWWMRLRTGAIRASPTRRSSPIFARSFARESLFAPACRLFPG